MISVYLPAAAAAGGGASKIDLELCLRSLVEVEGGWPVSRAKAKSF